MSIQETITWHEPTEQLPDVDVTVLIHIPGFIKPGPVWLGWYDGVFWFGVGDIELEDDAVVRWAELPKGNPA